MVIGASRGLGKGMARGLHEAGATVVITGTSDRIKMIAEEMSSLESPVYGVTADFQRQENVEKAFWEAVELLRGEVDILVNNAGIQQRFPCAEFPLESWNTILNVNLTSVFIMSQLAGKMMLEKLLT